jgi:hypothetical protein
VENQPRQADQHAQDPDDPDQIAHEVFHSLSPPSCR